MLEKFCIFCGGKPEKKNMEHVIPQWLIRMAGMEKEDIFSYYRHPDKHVPFMRFAFPACTECNSKFAKLEASVKPVLENVLSGQSISGSDAMLLMMWFDKIRIGLWLANIYYKPELRKNCIPRCFINEAVIKADRMLSIQKLVYNSEDKRAILWNGTNTVWFNNAPYAFTMIINDYYFLNASCHNLVSAHLGFPVITNQKIKDNALCDADFIYGKHKIVNPVVQGFIPNKESITFYQPIYRDYLHLPNLIIDDYTDKHSYSTIDGVGGVFAQKGNKNNIRYLHPNDRIGMKLRAVSAPNLVIDVLNFQNIIQSKNIVSRPGDCIGKEINDLLLESIKRQK